MATVVKDNEKQSVEDNRRQFFRALLNGEVPNDDIEALVHRLDISPHDVKKLKKAGCDPEKILRILL